MDLPKPDLTPTAIPPANRTTGPDPVSDANAENSEIKQDLRKNRPVLLVAGGIALMIVGIALGAVITTHRFSPKNQPGPVSVTPTPEFLNLTDTDPVATSSGFTDLVTAQASLSGLISNFNPDDQSVSPPVLDMSLDFQ
jgi:hypothetical protein